MVTSRRYLAARKIRRKFGKCEGDFCSRVTWRMRIRGSLGWNDPWVCKCRRPRHIFRTRVSGPPASFCRWDCRLSGTPSRRFEAAACRNSFSRDSRRFYGYAKQTLEPEKSVPDQVAHVRTHRRQDGVCRKSEFNGHRNGKWRAEYATTGIKLPSRRGRLFTQLEPNLVWAFAWEVISSWANKECLGFSENSDEIKYWEPRSSVGLFPRK